MSIVKSLREHFSNHDLFWIMIGIILLFILGYAVIHFDIVSIETFTTGMSKYNITKVAAVANAQ